MSGILDNKSRVIDAILTFEGRRQMAEGNFDVKYVTFSDRSVVYQKNMIEGHVDPTTKFYLEAFNAPYDQIIFEADDSGELVPFRQHANMGVSTVTGSLTSSLSWVSFINGKLKSRLQTFSTSSNLTGSYVESPVYGPNFASQIEGLLTSSIDNFNNLRVLGSIDPLLEDQFFALSSNEVSFTIVTNSETVQMVKPTNVNTIDSLFSDKKLRNVDNFRYLPPIKKTNSTSFDKKNPSEIIASGRMLGEYPPWGPIDKLTYSEISKELSNYESSAKTIYFDPTSRDNDLIAQFFEIREDQASKLDVIDYGVVNDNTNNPKAASHQVFFVGKVVVDDNGSDSFVHLFTLVFGSSEE